MGLCFICSGIIGGKNPCPYPECELCAGLFGSFESLAGLAAKKSAMFEWETFSCGCRIPKKILIAQERLWAENGIGDSDHLKNIINRKAGMFLEKTTGKKYGGPNSDVLFTLDFARNNAEVSINPTLIFGHYRKYARDVSQSIWTCKKCAGNGKVREARENQIPLDGKSVRGLVQCDKCKGRGVMYDSVEGIVGEPLRKAFEGQETSFHSSGREDVDAVMRGNGRPFAIEIKNPRKRHADLKKIADEINSDGRVKVSGLCIASPYLVKVMCNSHFEKEYLADISIEGGITPPEIKKILSLSGKTLSQQTPTRVLHRRADLERKRKLWIISAVKKGKGLLLKMRAEAGTYIKEFVSSDSGRTKPSVAGILGRGAKVEHLDVIRIHDGFLRKVKKR